MAFNFSLFSGLSRVSTVPAGSLAKASSGGANPVKGPLLFKVSIRPAAGSAAARVLKLPAGAAVAGMALARTPRINAKLAAFTFLSPDLFSDSGCLIVRCGINYKEHLLSQHANAIRFCKSCERQLKAGGECTGRKRGGGSGEQDDRRKAATVRLGRETPHLAAAQVHGAGGTGQTHQPFGGDAFQAGTGQVVSHAANAVAHRHGVRRGAGIFLHRRAQAARGGHRAKKGAASFSREPGRRWRLQL